MGCLRCSSTDNGQIYGSDNNGTLDGHYLHYLYIFLYISPYPRIHTPLYIGLGDDIVIISCWQYLRVGSF